MPLRMYPWFVSGPQHSELSARLKAWGLFVLEKSIHQVVEPSRSGNELWSHKASGHSLPRAWQRTPLCRHFLAQNTRTRSDTQAMPQPDSWAQGPVLHLWEFMDLGFWKKASHLRADAFSSEAKLTVSLKCDFIYTFLRCFLLDIRAKLYCGLENIWPKWLQIIVINSIMGDERIIKTFKVFLVVQTTGTFSVIWTCCSMFPT